MLDMPNTNPPTTTLEALEVKRAIAQASKIPFGLFFGAVCEQGELGNAEEIRHAEELW